MGVNVQEESRTEKKTDPREYLNYKEKREWNRLSPSEKKVFMPRSIKVSSARKAAEMFKNYLAEKNSAMAEQRMQMQEEYAQKRAENMGQLGRGSTVITGASLSLMLISAVTFVVQIFTVFLMVMLSILTVILFLVIVVSILITMIAALFDSNDIFYTGYGGDAMVAVALEEVGYKEKETDVTKYGKYTNTDGLSWCHAFVSWCANRCGFVEAGIFPKTALCETGRQWFVKRKEYQISDGKYIPQPGDIIYFDFTGMGESHHVGIVEFTENGVVHTIEGNKGDQVAKGSYDITSSKIMGYGQPAYPEDGIEGYASEEFLTTCRTLAKEIVDNGHWIYSNSGVKRTWALAKAASTKKTNCAHYVSLCMQEFGSLKKGQTFYSDGSHHLVATTSVKSQIKKYYDVIDVGGKIPENTDLKTGDICLWNAHTNVYAGRNSAGKLTWYDFGKSGTTDDKAESGTFNRLLKTSQMSSQKIYTILRLKDQDSYGSGITHKIPDGLGDSYTYMGWSLIKDSTSAQYKLREQSGEKYDAKGFAKIGGRFVIACTTTFGAVGDYLDFVLSNGKVVHAIMGDEKSQSDVDCNMWGHQYGHCVLEFCVKKSSWYGSPKTVIGQHPEWSGTRVVKVINLGKNYFK